MASCKHRGCERHRPDNKPHGWEKRPLPCRLGLHGHYESMQSVKKDDDTTYFTCLVCYYGWEHKPPPMLGMGE